MLPLHQLATGKTECEAGSDSEAGGKRRIHGGIITFLGPLRV